MHPSRILILQGISSIRSTDDAEVAAALTPEEQTAPRSVLRLDTRDHEQAIASGYWAPVDDQVYSFAADVLGDIAERGVAKVVYVGIDEVPTLVALGAFLSDEHRILSRDYDRDRGVFQWPETAATVEFEPVGVPLEPVEASGDVILRIELSYPVQTPHVHAAVANRLADISIRPKGVAPRPGLLRSQEDLEAFRLLVRSVLAEIDRLRPGTEVIHLFLAGSVSACLAVGQELRLRNGRRVQTYRYRAADVPPQTPAILLTPEAHSYVQASLTDDDLAIARDARGIWRVALADLNDHAKSLKEAGAWPDYLVPVLAQRQPHPKDLGSIWQLVEERDRIADGDVIEFRFDRDDRIWYVPDTMLLAMSKAATGDREQVRRLARAFLWHEYLHEYQNLTEHSSAGVGRFPNCLERVDYLADAYGTLHQVDFSLRQTEVSTDIDVINQIWIAITEAIDAFWTFVPPAPTRFWQTRRLRRFLNWYLRRAQIRHAKTLEEAIDLLCEPPIIEIAGPRISTDARRTYLDLERMHASDELILALVDKHNKLQLFPSQTTLSIPELLAAFRTVDRPAIDAFFSALVDQLQRRA